MAAVARPVGRGLGLGIRGVLGIHGVRSSRRGLVGPDTGSVEGNPVEAGGLVVVAQVAAAVPGSRVAVAWRMAAVQGLGCVVPVPVPDDTVEGLVGTGWALGSGLGSYGGAVRGCHGHHGPVVVGKVVEGQWSPGT